MVVAKSKVRRDQEEKVATWLCDAYGHNGDTIADFKRAGRDFIEFLKANGWELRPTVMIIRERQQANAL